MIRRNLTTLKAEGWSLAEEWHPADAKPAEAAEAEPIKRGPGRPRKVTDEHGAEIINRSLRVLRVIGAGETATSDDSSDALAVLNQMLQSLSLQRDVGVSLPIGDVQPRCQPDILYGWPDWRGACHHRPFKILDGYVRLNGIDYPVQLVDAPTYDSYAKKRSRPTCLTDASTTRR